MELITPFCLRERELETTSYLVNVVVGKLIASIICQSTSRRRSILISSVVTLKDENVLEGPVHESSSRHTRHRFIATAIFQFNLPFLVTKLGKKFACDVTTIQELNEPHPPYVLPRALLSKEVTSSPLSLKQSRGKALPAQF